MATFVVNTILDDGGLVPDGLISLREAIVAANTNETFGDAPAGDADGDSIIFDAALDGMSINLSDSLGIESRVVIRAGSLDINIVPAANKPAFEIPTTHEVRLTGLRITGSEPDSQGISHQSGTLRLTNMQFSNLSGAVSSEFGSLRIVDSIFENNSAGALSINTGNSIILRSQFRSNARIGDGGAIFVSGGDHTISESLFDGNRSEPNSNPVFATAGGAIKIEGFTTEARIFESEFRNNAAQIGGAISNESRLFIGQNSLFTNNSAISEFTAGGGAIHNNFVFRLVDSEVSFNTADRGGGIYNNFGFMWMIRSTVNDNRANAQGGGLWLNGNVRINSSEITRNEAGTTTTDNEADQVAGNGGGIFVTPFIRETDLRVDDSLIADNFATHSGGGIHAENTPDNDDTLFVDVRNETRIRGNSVTLPISSADAEVAKGGGIFTSANVFRLNTTQSTFNRSTGDGGGIYVESGYLRLDESRVSGNKASRNGGGIFVESGRASLFSSIVGGEGLGAANVAGEFVEGGTLGLGGGIYVSSASESGSRLFMSGGEVGFNVAKISGGGITSLTGSVVRLENNVLVSTNRALVSGGGGIFNDGAQLTLRDSVFEENTARDGGGILHQAGTADFLRSTIRLNEARQFGGGMFSNAFFVLNETPIIDNEARVGPDLFTNDD